MKKLILATTVSVYLAGCSSTTPTQDAHSSKLASSELAQTDEAALHILDTNSQQKVYIKASPAFNTKNYHAVIIEPSQIDIAQSLPEQVPEDLLPKLQTRLDSFVNETTSTMFTGVEQAGEGVFRVKVSLREIDISNEGLNFYEFIPIGLAAAGVSTAIGTRDQEVALMIEAEITDSLTNETLALGRRVIPGEELENAREKLTLDKLESGILMARNDIKAILFGLGENKQGVVN